MYRPTAFEIKCAAFSLMLVDHLGRLLLASQDVLALPDVLPWVMIGFGRLSFPTFAWLAAQGAKHTSNAPRYVRRLLIFGVFSQPVYAYFSYLLEYNPLQLNILFTLAVGVATLRMLKRRSPVERVLGLMVILPLAEIISLEGGWWGVMTVVWMGWFQPRRMSWYLGYALIALADAGWTLQLGVDLFHVKIQLLSLLAPLVFAGYSGLQGLRTRWFYALYPLHFAGLVGLKWALDVFGPYPRIVV